ncbi:hypothetical protein SRHO_G00245390 [Serrasalmus rhombeus]
MDSKSTTEAYSTSALISRIVVRQSCLPSPVLLLADDSHPAVLGAPLPGTSSYADELHRYPALIRMDRPGVCSGPSHHAAPGGQTARKNQTLTIGMQ